MPPIRVDNQGQVNQQAKVGKQGPKSYASNLDNVYANVKGTNKAAVKFVSTSTNSFLPPFESDTPDEERFNQATSGSRKVSGSVHEKNPGEPDFVDLSTQGLLTMVQSSFDDADLAEAYDNLGKIGTETRDQKASFDAQRAREKIEARIHQYESAMSSSREADNTQTATQMQQAFVDRQNQGLQAMPLDLQKLKLDDQDPNSFLHQNIQMAETVSGTPAARLLYNFEALIKNSGAANRALADATTGAGNIFATANLMKTGAAAGKPPAGGMNNPPVAE